MNASLPRHSRSLPRGFTLVEVVVVLLIVSILIAMAAMMTRGMVAAQKRSLTATRIATVEAALVSFVSQQKRLPCPADGTLVSNNNLAGFEGNRTAAGCTGNQQNGVVPWIALGITEVDATDGWDRRLTYRVGVLLTADNGMDMSGCDPAAPALPPVNAVAPTYSCQPNCTSATIGTACTHPLSFLTNNNLATAVGKGLQVRNLAGVVLMNPNANPHTGAAYVVVSAGESGGGAYLSSGVLGASTTGEGTEELKNFASLPFVNSNVTYYVDDSPNTTPGATHFDDIIARPSIMTVATKAGLGPRTH
jgi:prepilin-type N-terminal cleavage/methylation domain-containing protein